MQNLAVCLLMALMARSPYICGFATGRDFIKWSWPEDVWPVTVLWIYVRRRLDRDADMQSLKWQHDVQCRCTVVGLVPLVWLHTQYWAELYGGSSIQFDFI